MALSQLQKDQIKKMAIDGHTEHEIAKAVGVSRGTVRKYKPLQNEQRQIQNEQFVQNYTKVKNEINNKWLDKLSKDDRQEQIADKILNLLNDDQTLKKEIAIGGIRSIVGAYKIIVETAIKTKDLQLKEEKQEQENILNESDTMNDNFENAMVEAVKSFKEVDYRALIEKDSIDNDLVN